MTPWRTALLFAAGIVVGVVLSGALFACPVAECNEAQSASPREAVTCTCLPPDAEALAPASNEEGLKLVTLPPRDAAGGDAWSAPSVCPEDAPRLSALLCRFIDIDFIEFVLSSCPNPQVSPIVDIGIYQGAELVHMARIGFPVVAFEPNPYRYNVSLNDVVSSLSVEDRKRVDLRNQAVGDALGRLYFQLAGLDSHAYVLRPGETPKPKSIQVDVVPIAGALTSDKYFVKVDTQGFDTRIVSSLLRAMKETGRSVTFIQFEFSPFFEVTRANVTAAEHKRFFRRLIAAGYDVYMGAAVQPWLRSHRSTYGKSPLAMLAPDPNVPTCVDEFVDHMHASKHRAIRPRHTSTDIGSWMDILAVKRTSHMPYYRHTGWVLSKRM
mgnify:CR=1 FL=1